MCSCSEFRVPFQISIGQDSVVLHITFLLHGWLLHPGAVHGLKVYNTHMSICSTWVWNVRTALPHVQEPWLSHSSWSHGRFQTNAEHTDKRGHGQQVYWQSMAVTACTDLFLSVLCECGVEDVILLLQIYVISWLLGRCLNNSPSIPVSPTLTDNSYPASQELHPSHYLLPNCFNCMCQCLTLAPSPCKIGALLLSYVPFPMQCVFSLLVFHYTESSIIAL